MAQYYYLDSNNTQQGPVDESQLIQNGVTRYTLVWSAGMPDWCQAGDVTSLGYLFNTTQQNNYNPAGGYAQAGNQSFYGQQAAYNQPTGYGNIPGPAPSSNLVWAILTTILCCLPLGVVSIIYASQVDTEWSRGNYAEAYRKSRLARNWAIASASIGIVGSIIYVICVLLGAFASAINF